MRITDKEMKKVLEMGGNPVPECLDLHESSLAESDKVLAQQVVQDVLDMPDREDRIEEIKAAIDAGEFNPTGAEIADAMSRRSIADRIR